MTEILAYGPVGSFFGFSAADFALALRGAGDALVRVHSDGGDALEGLAIANVIRAHKGRVAIRVEGLCASAATPMLCTAAEVEIAPGALVMLHEVRTFAEGDATELRAQAEVVEKITASYRLLYANKTGKGDEEIAALVKKNGWAVGSWLTAAEAVELGLADRIGDPVQLAAARPQARVLNSPAARFYLGSAGTKGPKMTEEQSALRKRLGLSADAPKAQVKAALAEMEAAAEGEPDGDEEKEGEEGEEEKKEPKAEGAEEPDGDEKDPEAMKAALAEQRAVIAELRAKLQAAPQDADQKERQVRADVDKWVKEGRIAASRRDHFLGLHRAGKAEGIVRYLDAGTHTTSQALRGGRVGTVVEFTDNKAPAGDDPAAAAKNIIDGVKARGSRALGLVEK